MSVPGLIGSQYFALLAATEKRGSTTMIGMRRSTACANSCTCELCMFSPRCEPIRTRQSVFAMSVGSGEPRPAPNVSVNPTSRGPRHCAYDGPAKLIAPQLFSTCWKKRWPMPCVMAATASGPCSRLDLLHLARRCT